MRSKASPASAPPRNSATVAAEVAELDAIAGDRAKALASLEGRRPGLVERGDVDEIETLDTQIRRGRIEAEVTAARRTKLVAEHDALKADEAHRADQAARRAAYMAAQDAAKEAGGLLEREYPAMAQALAGLLGRVAECRKLVEAANARLPEGEEPIAADFEPSRGRAATPATTHTIRRHLWVHSSGATSVLPPSDVEKGWKRQVRKETVTSDGLLAVPHIPLGDMVSLPGLRYGDAPFWSPRPFAFAKPDGVKADWRNFITDPPAPNPAPAQPGRTGW